MSRMYGDRINEFVLSVDIMNEETFMDLMTLMNEYLEQQLGVVYFSVLEEGLVDANSGLITLWSSTENKPMFSVDKDDGYNSFSAYSFGENTPLWVVSKTGQELKETDDYEDLWSGREDLPRFRSTVDSEVKTTVIHPLHRASLPIGVMRFACEDLVRPTPASHEEVEKLAATISRAYRMYDLRDTQQKNTGRALRLLEESLTAESWTRLALPHIFVAYPGGPSAEGPARDDHQRVIATIRQVIEEFSDVVTSEFWEDSAKTGNITEELINSITAAEFGLCYFSEPTDGPYVDNDNVLFEAGMMQALANSPGGLLRAWIGVREADAAPLPFDIRNERMLSVARTDDGTGDQAAFADGLSKYMNELVADLKRRDS